ncbi:MAG: hypothetical protein R6X15_02500 [Pseudomonadota bacterium]
MTKASAMAGLLVLLLHPAAQAVELTGRFSMLGVTALAEEGELGYLGGDYETLTADQQSLRLMLDEAAENGEWSLHLKTLRQHQDGFTATAIPSSALFRYRDGDGNWLDEEGAETSTRVGYEIDRVLYRQRLDNFTLGVGRQPIDWGSGRFWQPLNVFGAFSPTDLDTDFKPGIDAATLDWYPSPFSSLTAAYVLAPKEDEELDNSAAFYYRRGVGEISELSLLGGTVIGNQVMGGGFESAWGGMGWRVEGLHYRFDETDESAFFWVAGVDYQFDDGTLLVVEWYDNSRGATKQEELAGMTDEVPVIYGLQQHLGRRVAGLSIARDITPLLHGSYTLLANSLRDDDGEDHLSQLHQINLTYSVSNEADLLMSILTANGEGLSDAGLPQSEFGHLPGSLSLRLRFYF